ncbi:MAG: 23S rRNA (uracil(1939)-C(5))-methyltransferase RlmD [Cyanobacteria bacterium QS_8_64_29]|nr:MAG: 23S rRNA (uracil(1939)-C(5))-methyltransferase RlmD [Cyanobacteria bacterium QS_8_64_29]
MVDLSASGDGVGRAQGRVVFVPNTVTGDHALVRLTQIKSQYARDKLQELRQPSPHRIRPRCIVADTCGGCQWQHIDDAYQRSAKRERVARTLERIGGFRHPPVEPILAGESPLHYRNKVTYPLEASRSGRIRAGYYRPGSHKLVNLNQCPVQDERLDPLLAELKQDIQCQGWRPYDEDRDRGQLRYLSLRVGRRTGEVLLTLVSTSRHLKGLKGQAKAWLQRYPQLVGVCLNRNPRRSNAIFGPETRCVAGQPFARERLAGLEFRLTPETFFQINTEVAEQLLNATMAKLQPQARETLLDAYCGVGTFTLPLAAKVQRDIGLEAQPSAIAQARRNAHLNGIANASFRAEPVERGLRRVSHADIAVLDPPRKGCERDAIAGLQRLGPRQIAYISCNPATLARYLAQLCRDNRYRLTGVKPADFFPQTAHVECVALLQRC